jgi:2-polyprenyl-3-methyl-5-hydroxy-6-metoxy-1,4-benzoquinol methylase
MKTLYRACPLCEARDFALLLEADCTQHPHYKPELPPRMTWMRCAACTHVFTDGYWTPEALALVFSATHPQQRVGYDVENQRLVSARMIERVLPYRAAGRWLDVGFGNASLLFTAREYGFEAAGLDLRAREVETLRKIGIAAELADIAQFQPAAPFAVVSMMDVLEHMPYPKQGLAAAHRLLEPGGVLYLSMPNMETDVWKLLDAGRANPYWAEIEHHHNFGRTRLYALLGECGFEPLRYGVGERYRVCMEVVARKRAA